MKIVLLFAVLLGTACGFLNHPYEYTFDYEGRITMGIPEIRSKMSGAGIKSKVTVQSVDYNTVLVKMQDVQVGESIEETECYGRPMEINIPYRQVQGEAKLLEQPFEIHYRSNEGNVMVVSKGEPEWITNIRKSFAYTMGLRQLEKINSPHEAQEIFGREQTLYGNCDVSYTVVPPMMVHKESNAQYTEVIRSVDFDKCNNRMIISQAGVGNLTEAGHGQFSAVQSRSSVSRYQLEEFNGSSYDIRSVVAEGTVTTNPFGFNTDKMVVFTNQTLFLRNKGQISHRFTVPNPTRMVRSWQMEAYSPYTPGSNPVPWVNFHPVASQEEKYLPLLIENVATGVKLTTDLYRQFQEELEKYIHYTAQELNEMPRTPRDSNSPNPWKYANGKATYYLDSAVRIIRALPQENIRQLLQKFRDQVKQGEIQRIEEILMIDIMGASGAASSYTVLLQEIRKGKISENRASSIFMTITNNIVSPTMLDDLVKYVKELDLERTPYLTSTVWINFASTLNRLCFNPYSWKYSVPHQIFGTRSCKAHTLLDEILPFFKEKLQATREQWQHIVIVQALSNLGTPHSLHLLTDIVRDSAQRYDTRVKGMALYALTHSRMVKSARQQVFNILMPVIFDTQHPTELRQVAIFVALTWHPSQHFWQRLAVQSWREERKEMGAFLYFLTQSYAHGRDPTLERQSEIARFVLNSFKPFPPMYRQVYENFWASHLPKDHMSTDANLFWLDNYGEFLPRHLYYFLYNSFGGMKTPLFEFFYVSDNHQGPIHKIFNELRGTTTERSEQLVRDRYHRDAQNVLSSIKEQLSPEFRERNNQQMDLSVLLKFFKNIQLYVPINQQAFQKYLGPEGSRLLKEMVEGKRFEFTKFFNPVQIETLMPSEIGLPILTRVASPTIHFGDSHLKLVVEGKQEPTVRDLIRSNQVTLKVSNNYKFITKTISTVRTLLPWNMKLIATGVDSLKNFNLPATYNFTYTHNDYNKNLTMAVQPRITEQFPLVHMHNIPFVLIKRFYPGEEKVEDIQFECIKTKGKQNIVEDKYVIKKGYTGLDGYVSWTGDVPYPFTRGYVMDLMRQPQKTIKLLVSPTARLWASTLALNFDRSTTKNLYGSVALVKPVMGGSPPFNQDENRQISGVPLSKMYNFVGRLMLNGTQTRFFETIFSYLHQNNKNNKNTYLFGIDFHRSQLPGYDSKTTGYCLDMHTETPYVPNYERFFRQLSNNQMTIDMNAKITGGQKCQAQQIATIEGKAGITEQLRKLLVQELRHTCYAEPSEPLVRKHTDAVYDYANMEVNFRESNIPANFKNFTYNAYDIIRGLAHPHSYFNYMYVNHPKDKINVRAVRIVPNQRWLVNTTMPTETAYFERFWVPSAIEDLMPLGGFYPRHGIELPSFFVRRTIPDVCVIKPQENKLSTFDGTQVPLRLTPCYTVLAMDKEYPDSLIVKARKSPRTQEPELKVVSPKHGVSLELTPEKVQINGEQKRLSSQPEPLYTSSGKFFAEVRKIGQTVELKVPGNMTLKVVNKEEIVIQPAARLQNALSGLCGDFNGEPKDDLVTPSGKKVSSEQKEELQYLWTIAQGDQCDTQKLEQEKREARRELEDKHQHRQQEHRRRQESSSECTVFVHPIETYESSKGKMVCLSKEPVPRCHPSCQEKSERKFDDEYICFEEQKAPREVIRSLRRGYTKASVNVQSEIERRFNTKHVNICRNL